MTLIEGVVLGAVQGLTEFIPVSSSGHIVIFQQLMSGASDHLFIEWINIGTLIALIIFFRKRIHSITKEIIIEKNSKLAINILVACLPAGVVGFLLADFVANQEFFGSAITVSVALAVVGVVMIVLERLPRLGGVASLEHLSWRRSLIIGIAQVMALIPGISRSGSTIIAGRIGGLSREHSAEFSFLISIPIMLGVILKLLLRSSDRLYLIENFSTLMIANLVAFLAGFFAIGFMMRYLRKNSLAIFGWYRVGLAVVIGVFILLQ